MSKYEDMIVIFMSIFLMAQIFTVVNLARVANSMATVASCIERYERRVLELETRVAELERMARK